ncbi:MULTISPECIES: oligopeptide/dipeptide ABC transporter ATP-binding protein [unclassified Roseitalea]|uniref:oligopeptide/dipeptide ABC transporter ATP-binding protein n=1 Tax=unclassified Roseitalea TaxID=2639107 RepID=UPI00273D6E74|nr:MULTISPECIES: oligopeptide/dipeptide ABC transporter ATP-binding protein [unclassified Roseitalea]
MDADPGSKLDADCHPRHPYTDRLLECDPARQSERSRVLPTIPGSIPDLRDRPAGCIFASRCHRVHDVCAEAPGETVLDGGRHRARCWLAERPERDLVAP